MLKLYGYKQCGTCRKAEQFLQQAGIGYEFIDITENPPAAEELAAIVERASVPLNKLFNTSGLDYRAQKIGEQLPSLTEAQALALLASNGNHVKRPFALSPTLGLVGFKEETWTAALKPK